MTAETTVETTAATKPVMVRIVYTAAKGREAEVAGLMDELRNVLTNADRFRKIAAKPVIEQDGRRWALVVTCESEDAFDAWDDAFTCSRALAAIHALLYDGPCEESPDAAGDFEVVR